MSQVSTETPSFQNETISFRAVFNNPNRTYWSQVWSTLCGNWNLASTYFQFLISSLWDRNRIYEMNRNFETIVLMPSNLSKLPDPEIFELNDGSTASQFAERSPHPRGVEDRSVEFMVVFRPFKSTGYFWMPDRIEYHNLGGMMMLMGQLEIAGWQLNYELMACCKCKCLIAACECQTKCQSECKSECPTKCQSECTSEYQSACPTKCQQDCSPFVENPMGLKDPMETEVLQNLTKTDGLVQCLETN